MDGSILVGNDSELTLTLANGSTFTGSISGNITNAAGNTVSTETGKVDVTLGDDCTWNLTADSKCEPIIKRTSVYLAPELTADIPDSGEKRSSGLHYFFSSPKQMMIDWDTEQTISAFRYLPPQNTREGLVTHYTLWGSTDWNNWQKLASGEFSNIVNNPIWQTIKFAPTKAKILRLDADRLAEGERMTFGDIEIVY